MPYVFLRSNKPHKYNFNLRLVGSLQRPNVNQILPVIDNSNPYITNIGNIGLQNFMRYNNWWRYQRILGLGKILSFDGWIAFTLNPVVNSNSISEQNYSVSEVLNYKHSYWSSHSTSILWPFKPLSAQLQLELEYNTSQSFFIRNTEELEINNIDLGLGTSIQFNEFDKWSLELEYFLYQNKGRIGNNDNNAYLNQEVYASLYFAPVDWFEINSELDWEIFGANGNVGAYTIPIWSADLSFFLDKAKKWSVGAKAFDILDKNQNLWRWWNANRFVESQSNAVSRYVMATVSYKIRKAGTESD